MMRPRRITTLEECNTSAWQVQSAGYDTFQDARRAAARVFTIKAGAMVKPYQGKFAVFFWNRGDND